MVMGVDLLATLREQAIQKDNWDSTQPMACPNDGTPLLQAPESGVLFCPFDGWQYPRDWDVSVHSGM
jgi:hypothetical protein